MLKTTNLIGFGAGGSAAVVPPIPTTALVHHWIADTGITGSAPVTAWTDGIGSRDLVHATDGPSLEASQIDGFSSLRFNGTDDKLQEATGNLAQPIHVFLVMNQISWTITETIFGETTDVNNPSLVTSGTTPNIKINGTGTETSGATVGTWHLVGAYFNGASSYTSVDGTDTSAAGSITSVFSGGVSIGARGATAFSNVEFAEIAVYSSERLTTELGLIEAYFAAKFPTLSIT